MKKDIVFWIGVINENPLMMEKHGGFKYLEYSRLCWQKWCEKNDVIFFDYSTPSEKDIMAFKPTVTRWFDVFEQIKDLLYNKILVIDGSTLIRSDTPNFFNKCLSKHLTVFRSLENLRWLYEGVTGYQELFPDVQFDITRYVSCGMQIFDEDHKPFLDLFTKFYKENHDQIIDLQNRKVKRGTDQPVYNYLLQKYKEPDKVLIDWLPKAYMMTHLSRFDWLSYNWQLQQDGMPFFIKYGYIWFFSGFPNRGARENLMKQTWDLIKQGYE